jgi:hypothetical protein
VETVSWCPDDRKQISLNGSARNGRGERRMKREELKTPKVVEFVDYIFDIEDSILCSSSFGNNRRY